VNGRFLLDTNIVIALIAKDSSVERGLASAEKVYVPSLVLGELYFGARASAQKDRNLARIDEFAAANAVLVPDVATAREYGILKAALRAKGRLIPENDMWIAAIARQHSLTLITRDAHFREIEGLTTEDWR
jgi:tRNA(fMet)-specific endonuclease VapC